MSIFNFFLALTLSITSLTIGYCQKSASTFQKVEVLEILQVNSYTYLFVKENDIKRWLAVPSIKAKIGETYFYKSGMKMSNFNSEALNRTFDSVLFLGSISKTPNKKEKSSFQHSSTIKLQKTVKPAIEKLILTIKPVNDGISIAELLKNKKKYENKTVKVKGQVTKFSSQIMSKNWIHLQDGTEFNDKFDIILTTNTEVKLGDVIIMEGKVSLDRDFGYGYFYDLIIENSVLVK
ncbi:MAG: hypothetical protein L3J20_00240 [Flavobacteriaceae bacterium]|nr:hypothetical protein [Flavobacteriaceae bacterium]